jgi:hypothetical protein
VEFVADAERRDCCRCRAGLLLSPVSGPPRCAPEGRTSACHDLIFIDIVDNNLSTSVDNKERPSAMSARGP